MRCIWRTFLSKNTIAKNYSKSVRGSPFARYMTGILGIILEVLAMHGRMWLKNETALLRGQRWSFSRHDAIAPKKASPYFASFVAPTPGISRNSSASAGSWLHIAESALSEKTM